MSAKKQRFADEYVLDRNATRAAQAAGYSARTAYSQGHRLLQDAEVKATIDAHDAQTRARHAVTAERVIEELRRIAFIDPRRIFTWGPNGLVLRPSEEPTEEEAACVIEANGAKTPAKHERTTRYNKEGGVVSTTERDETPGESVKVKLADKLKALELLGKNLGLFKDRVEHSGPDGGPIALQTIRRVIVDPEVADD